MTTRNPKLSVAARECKIPYENAKVIYYVFQRQGRVDRKYQIAEESTLGRLRAKEQEAQRAKPYKCTETGTKCTKAEPQMKSG